MLRQFLGGFFKGDEDAGLVVSRGAANQEFHGEQSLACAGAAANESGTAAGKPPPVISSSP